MVQMVENGTRQEDSHVELSEAHREVSDSTGHRAEPASGSPRTRQSRRQRAQQPEVPAPARIENRENAAHDHGHDGIPAGTPAGREARASPTWDHAKADAESERASPAHLPPPARAGAHCEIGSPPATGSAVTRTRAPSSGSTSLVQG